jgi:broad specificity phosphatase PhoE
MTSTSLILIRHGHVADNDGGVEARLCGWFDPPLSSLGEAQVGRLRARFAGDMGIDALYSSSLRRAVDTARALGDAVDGQPILVDSLREIHCGLLDGQLLNHVRLSYPDLWQRNLAQTDETFGWPGGETYQAFRHRVVSALHDIIASHPGGRVAIVTHAGVISQIAGLLTGQSAARWDTFRAGNASVTELHWSGRGCEIVRFDDRSHLKGLGAPASVGSSDDAQAVASGANGITLGVR